MESGKYSRFHRTRQVLGEKGKRPRFRSGLRGKAAPYGAAQSVEKVRLELGFF